MPDKAAPESPFREGTLLGFDFGLRRIGVAVGQTATRTASPLATIRHGEQPDWQAIASLVGEWKPGVLIVGLPLDGEGLETEMSRSARKFGKELERRFARTVFYSDERLTSRAAEAQFAELRSRGEARRKDAGKLDAVAAKIILENWLQSQPH